MHIFAFVLCVFLFDVLDTSKLNLMIDLMLLMVLYTFKNPLAF